MTMQYLGQGSGQSEVFHWSQSLETPWKFFSLVLVNDDFDCGNISGDFGRKARYRHVKHGGDAQSDFFPRLSGDEEDESARTLQSQSMRN